MVLPCQVSTLLAQNSERQLTIYVARRLRGTMTTLAQDSDSDSDSSSDSDVSYDSFDEYPHEAVNMKMKVVDYDSKDERRQAEQNRKIK